jgi:hypothetical protein
MRSNIRTALLAASALFMASTALDESNAASPVIQQCINPNTGTVFNTDFCRCLGLTRSRADEWIITGSNNAACLKADVTAAVNPDVVDDVVDDPPVVDDPRTAGDWPGWGGNQVAGAPGDGTGDQKHNHAGPPTESPGQSIAGPPGLRD